MENRERGTRDEDEGLIEELPETVDYKHLPQLARSS